MDFDAAKSARTYSDRTVSQEWLAWWSAAVAPGGKDVIDLGCGGGIYVRGFAALGASRVIGIDGSKQYLHEAASTDEVRGQFACATVAAVPLASACADVVFSRAVIHHLAPAVQREQAREATRLLRPGGVFAVQDRTMNDVHANEERFWIRATLFAEFPDLVALEAARRPDAEGYSRILREVGFDRIEVETYPEMRTVHPSFEALAGEIRDRKGKSILFELDDRELARYIEALAHAWSERGGAGAVPEIDPWTVWRAYR